MKEKSEVEKTAEKASKINGLADVKHFLQTTCTVLDLAIANKFPGGIPLGRIVQFYGGFSTCKSVLASAILGSAQRRKFGSYYGDIENTLDPKFAEFYGLFYKKLSNIKDFTDDLFPDTIESFFDRWLTNIIFKDGKKRKQLNTKPKVVVTDTITALPAKIEADKEMHEQGFGAYRAKQLSLGYRKYIKSLSYSDTTLVIIDQTRSNFGSAFGGEVVPGGKGPEYYPSVRVHLKKSSYVINAAGMTVGVWVNFKVTKNKIGPPFREGRFKILFDKGLDDIDGNLYFLSEVQNGKDKAKNKTQKLLLWGEEHTRKWWIKRIEAENEEERLRKTVWEVWQKQYETAPRKIRTFT